MDDPRDLLVGPRGRRLCLELAGRLASDADAVAGEEYLRAVGFASYALDPGAGTSRVMFEVGGGTPRRRIEPRATPSADQVARLLDGVPLGSVDERVLFDALTRAVDWARYWQEPDGEDVLADAVPMRDALLRFAAAVAVPGRVPWWATPIDRGSQWTVVFDESAAPLSSPPAAGITAGLARWRSAVVEEEARALRERPADPRAPFSGTWWSTPPRDLTRTTRHLGVLGPVGLWLVEDSFDWESAVVRPVEVPADARVLEVDGPAAWSELCRRFPLEVTASRRHDWYRTTGSAGRWVIPDWSLAAQEIDAVHLTVAGYLTTAGRCLDVTDDTSAVLAGWNPDETYWLTEVPERAEGAERWSRGDDGAWSRD